ncbi:MAG: hypothetical protein M1118_02350 [Chloroflexi bacterium]|nr:hypothetical protein [Chloroflexota bacterium]
MMNGQQRPSRVVTIEFLMRSGETFTVSDFVDEDPADEGVRALGKALVSDMESGAIRQFSYWEGETFSFEAVKMDQVAAFTITANDEEDEEVEVEESE